MERFIASAISLVRMRAGRADQRAGDDQHGVADDEAGHRHRGSGERVEQRDDHGHVGAADRQHHGHAERERGERDRREHGEPLRPAISNAAAAEHQHGQEPR